jgi:hypothetical protein
MALPVSSSWLESCCRWVWVRRDCVVHVRRVGIWAGGGRVRSGGGGGKEWATGPPVSVSW